MTMVRSKTLINKITIVREFTFEAAHWLPYYEGMAGDLHGHTYKLEIGLRGDVDLETGMVADFSAIDEHIRESILKHVQHTCLNNLEEVHNFPHEVPTLENIVIWIVNRLINDITRNKLDYIKRNVPANTSINLVLVRLWETPQQYAEWTPRENNVNVNLRRLS